MRVGDTVATWSRTAGSKYFRAQPTSKWSGKLPVSFADETDDIQLQSAVTGWKLAKNAVMKIHDDVLPGVNMRSVVVNEVGWARVQQDPARKMTKGTFYIVLPRQTKGVKPQDRLYALIDAIPQTEPLDTPRMPNQSLIDEVTNDLQTWNDCFPAEARKKLEVAMSELQGQFEKAMEKEKQMGFNEKQKPLSPHQVVARCKTRVNVLWMPDEMHETMRKVFEQGFVLDCPPRSGQYERRRLGLRRAKVV